mgnify:FL=1
MIAKEDLNRCHIASGDGESIATAYVFDSDYTEDEAVALEYEALSELYGCAGRGFVNQEFLMEESKCLDAITFYENDRPRTIYFDITQHFGK